MPEPAQSPAGLEPNALERIPPLLNISPSIFVPLREDILNSELPRDRVERLKRILKTIDYQREGVKENILYMVEREKKRIMLWAAETEQEAGPPKIRAGLPPDEVDEVISNMEAPAEPGKDYNYPYNRRPSTPPGPDNVSLREQTVLDLLDVVKGGVRDLEGYEKHMAGIRQYYVDCLEREIARIDEAGLRPEERSGAKELRR
ncbi:hypothetical protein VTK56DRAFT_1663 [Thermocarpiscus australiensis]